LFGSSASKFEGSVLKFEVLNKGDDTLALTGRLRVVGRVQAYTSGATGEYDSALAVFEMRLVLFSAITARWIICVKL